MDSRCHSKAVSDMCQVRSAEYNCPVPEHLSSTVTIEEVSGERAEAPTASFLNHRLLSWDPTREKENGEDGDLQIVKY